MSQAFKKTNDNGYDIQNEIENMLWADCWICQFPGWWFNAPGL